MLPSSQAQKVERLRKAGMQHVRGLLARGQSKRPLLVSGVQRSGTNMLLGVLEASVETSVFREGDPRAFDNYALRTVDEVQRLIAASPAPTVVVKALLEAGRLSELMAALDASAIWVFRGYQDMINSYVRTWPGGRNRLDQIVAGEALDDWRAQGLTPATLEVVRRHYDPSMSDADAIALFWVYRNQMFFDQGLAERTDVLPVFYDDLVARPTVVSRIICQFAHITYTPKLIRSVKSSSVRKNEPPALRPEIAGLCDEMLARLQGVYDPIFRA